MARQTTKRAPSADRILDAALALAAQKSWRSITMEEIADEAGATLAQVRTAFPSKTAMLSGFIRRTDAQVLEAHDPADSSEPVRERLLDVLLRRLDMLKPHKAAVRSIVRDTGCDPASLLCVAPAMLSAMSWCLEASGASASGPLGRMRAKALGAIYMSALRVWLNDETEDLSPTTAHLDRSLKRAEALMMRLPFAPRRAA